MFRNGIGSSGRRLRTRVQSVRRTTAGVDWNARDSRCDQEGGLPIRCERNRLCPRSSRGLGDRYAE